jgi:hypothetical protein
MADYFLCTDKAALIAYGQAKWPDPEVPAGYSVPGDVGTGWTKFPTYPLREAGLDERGQMQYERDPDRGDFIVCCVWYDEAERDLLGAEPYVTLILDTTPEQLAIDYPDHAAFGNSFGRPGA